MASPLKKPSSKSHRRQAYEGKGEVILSMTRAKKKRGCGACKKVKLQSVAKVEQVNRHVPRKMVRLARERRKKKRKAVCKEKDSENA